MIADLFKRQWMRIALGVVILAFFAVHVSGAKRFGFIERLESIAYDLRLVLTMPRTVDDRVVIVDIDEKSLAAEGRWPWSRAKIAALVDSLFDRYAVALVGVDVVFAEPEETSGLAVLDELEAAGATDDPRIAGKVVDLRSRLDHDARLARALESRPVVLGLFFQEAGSQGEAPQVGLLPEPLFPAGTFTGRNVPFERARGFSANLPELQRAALDGGHLISLPDEDGIVRRVPMLYEYDGEYYAALSLAVARAWLDGAAVTPGYPTETFGSKRYTGMEWLQIADRRIPVDERVRALIPFRGTAGSFPYVSATDVLHGTAEPAQLKDRIVLIGTTAKGLLDLRATPVAGDFPGVEAHANLVAGILDGSIMDNPAYTLGAEFVLLVVSGAIMVVVLPLLSPVWAAATTFALLAGILGVNLWIWYAADFVFPLAAGLLAVLTLFMFNMTWGFFVETRGKRQLAGLFGQYVPPQLVDEMSENPDAFTMETMSRELTVLFSDVRGFTTISEGLSEKDLTDLMNAYLSSMTRVIYEHRGTIDKYMGDAIMAFWGAPLEDPEHPRHALETAMAMRANLRELWVDFEKRGWPQIRVGIGLCTGVMRVGNMGSEYRTAYTVMGDAVNLGSRLEGLTKEYGVEIIVSDATVEAVPDYAYRELDRVRVKGKDKPVTIFEPIGPKQSVERTLRDEISVYREALKLYRAQNWDMAELQFLNLQKLAPDRALYRLYAERAALYREDPPGSGWDGVFTHKTK